MKQVLDEAGVRTPRHASTSTVQGVWEAAERIGYPLIVKPIAGAGSADTFRVDSAAELADVLPMIRHVEVVSVEEFIEAEEYTYDTVCGAGDVLFENISWYRPRPLQARSHEWISPMTVALRATDSEQLAGGRAMGREVLQALGFRAGFTHMEWYRKDDGEVVFGEIGARPPGARTVDVMNYATDGDLFQMWAEAVLTGTPAPLTHQYNAASIFKRAVGSGYITRVEGLDELMAAYADNVCVLDLLPIGAHRRDWRATLISDGMIVVRHPDLDALIELGDRFARDLRIYAG
jgi:biotin carboxylase